MAHINLSKNAFFNNLDIIAQLTSSKDKIAVVLKDNAYGHGLVETAQMCHEFGITKGVVRTQKEAQKVCDILEYVLVLADIPDKPLPNVVYTLNDMDTVERFPRGCNVEIKVDSGMHRNGVHVEAIAQVFARCREQGLHVKGVFTHHKSADELSSEWFVQEKNFEAAKKNAIALGSQYGFESLNFHSQNSAALFRMGECPHSMVRVGIAAYGCLQKDRILYENGYVENLRPVLSLFAKRLSSRTLQKGERIGYGGIYEAKVNITVSNYDVGYADGLLRAASNNYTTPHGYSLLGRISMDNLSLACAEEEVCIFDDANVYAKSCQTLGYEILVGMSEHLARSIV
jgi:alanine racemase